MATWYHESSLAFGSGDDVRDCARVFADVETAMLRARPNTVTFNDSGDDIWAGNTADLVRSEMDQIPELLRRFSIANRDVATALQSFAPRLDDYRQRFRSLQYEGRSTVNEIEQVERDRNRRIDEIESQGIDIGGWLTGYGNDPQVSSLNARLDRLQDELRRLKGQFRDNEDGFDDAIDLAVRLVRDADGVLYNNGWDKFWSQTLEPVLEVVRIVVEVLTVIVMLAVLFTGVGALAALILAGVLFAISVVQVAGTAAAGHEVTGEMWLTLAIDFAAVATLGAARYAKGIKLAAQANKMQADDILKAGRGKIGFTHATKLHKAQRLERQAHLVERAPEVFEGGLDMVEGGTKAADGDAVGAGISFGKGLLDISGISDPASDLFRAGHAGKGAYDGIVDIQSSHGGEPAPVESPRDWPGLDGMNTPS